MNTCPRFVCSLVLHHAPALAVGRTCGKLSRHKHHGYRAYKDDLGVFMSISLIWLIKTNRICPSWSLTWPGWNVVGAYKPGPTSASCRRTRALDCEFNVPMALIPPLTRLNIYYSLISHEFDLPSHRRREIFRGALSGLMETAFLPSFLLLNLL